MDQTDGAPSDLLASQATVPLNNGHTELEELRSLLLGAEQAQLAKLQERLDDSYLFANEMSRILPEAILLRNAKDDHLTKALTAPLEAAITTSVRKDPRPLVDAIAPVMGPAIRKAIAQAFSELTQGINQALERSFSKEGLLWRIEAWRTGKSFSEVVLSHTLLYRVEQVFLIHRKTGLLLQHVVRGTQAVPDADLISSMLTAIRDFAQDSFGTRAEDALDSFQVGELTVIVEQGPQALLAAVVRGVIPSDLRLVFQETIERVHLDWRQAFDEFTGDPTPFAGSRFALEHCLRMQTATAQVRPADRKLSPLFFVVGALATVALLWLATSLRDRWRWEAYLERLKNEPGLVVVSTEKVRGKYIIRGLRDPLAPDPAVLLRETALRPEQVLGQWELYQSLAPAFVLARAKLLLAPPAEVTLTFDNSVLSAAGAAPTRWILEARKMARALSGVTVFNEQQLLDSDAQTRIRKLKELEAAKAAIERTALYFPVNSIEMNPGQEEVFTQLIGKFQELFAAALIIGYDVRVDTIGRADRTGPEKNNQMLRQQRAERMIAELAARGLSAEQISSFHARSGLPYYTETSALNLAADRSVMFTVKVTDNQKKPEESH